MGAVEMQGKVVADAVLEDVAKRAARLREDGIIPGLGTILVGDDEASVRYVRKKHEALNN